MKISEDEKPKKVVKAPKISAPDDEKIKRGRPSKAKVEATPAPAPAPVPAHTPASAQGGFKESYHGNLRPVAKADTPPDIVKTDVSIVEELIVGLTVVEIEQVYAFTQQLL